MNLTLAELAALPLPAALLDRDEVVTHTPEWIGAMPGAVSYPMRRGRLVVGGGPASPTCSALVDRLLEELEALAAALAETQARRVTMLAAAVALLAGRVPSRAGSAAEVVALARSGMAARTALRLRVTGQIDADHGVLPAPAATALVLVQLAANAERHDGARSVDLDVDGSVFSLSWQARGQPAGSVPGAGAPAPPTSRRRADRSRWGLGFARIAADAVGGALYPPVHRGDGSMAAALELGLSRLNLPLCAVREGVVVKATRTWDEESAGLPGSAASSARLARCVATAERAGGNIVTVEGWSARSLGATTLVAVPPDGVVDRARDLLDGMAHERALWDGVPEPQRTRVAALAAILGSLLGAPVPRVPALAWNRAAPSLAAALSVPFPVPELTAIGATDPRVALFLAAEIGARFETAGDQLVLHLRDDRRHAALTRAVAPDGATTVRLS